MPIKHRGNRPYFYRSIRRGGRVTSQYVARGDEAEQLAERERAARDAQRQAIETARREFEDLTKRMATRDAALGRLAAAALEASGFYQHHQGTWRRRQTTMSGKKRADLQLAEATTKMVATTPAPTEDQRDWARRAVAGDPAALAELDTRLREAINRGDLAGFKRSCLALGADLGVLARHAAITWIFGDNQAQAQALEYKLAVLTDHLAGHDPSPVVRLLAERVALCWADVHTWDIRHLSMLQVPGGIAPTTDATLQRGRNQALKRYLAALKSLAQVQALGRRRVRVERTEAFEVEE